MFLQISRNRALFIKQESFIESIINQRIVRKENFIIERNLFHYT